jgi:putative transposase
LIAVDVVAASVSEREGGNQLLQPSKQPGKALSRLHTIWVDGGFDGEPFLRWVMDVCCWMVQVVLRPQGSKGFILLPKRWGVEPTLGWLMHCRRLVRDDEVLPETSETLYLPRHDPYYGEATSLNSYLAQLLKHPLSNSNPR